MRRIAMRAAYAVGGLLELAGLSNLACGWLNARWSPGQMLLRWGLRGAHTGTSYIKYDCTTGRVTEHFYG